MARYRITVSSTSRDAMMRLPSIPNVQLLDHGSGRTKDGGYRVDAFIDDADIPELEKAGYTVERHEDRDKVGRERQRQVASEDQPES